MDDRDELLARLEALEAEVAELRTARAVAPAGSPEPPPAAPVRQVGGVSRRGLLRGSGLALAGAAVAVAADVSPAAAASDADAVLGQVNAANKPTTIQKEVTGSGDVAGATLKLANTQGGAPLNLLDDTSIEVPLAGDIFSFGSFLTFAYADDATGTIYDSSWASQPLFLPAPFRVLDTRFAAASSGGYGRTRVTNPTGRFDGAGRLKSGQTIQLRLDDFSSGSNGVGINVTVTGPAAGGYLTTFATGQSRPTASTINFATNQTIANFVFAPSGFDTSDRDSISIYASATTHVIVDLTLVVAGGSEYLNGTSAGVQAAAALPSARRR